MPNEEAIKWAREEATRLHRISSPHSNKGTAGAAVEFLRTQAGARSHFYLQGDRARIMVDGINLFMRQKVT